MKKRILSACTAACVLAAMITGTVVQKTMTAAAESSDTIKILAMGDSITHGYINGDNGYRKYLCYYLQQEGMTDFDMVGPNNNWTDSVTYDWNGTTITYDPAHAGYSGYAIQAYNDCGSRSGLYETIFDNTYYNGDKTGNMIEAYDPDMILLQIGTNDLLDANTSGITDRLENLVDQIELYLDEDDVLFVASVPDIDAIVRYDWLGNYSWKYGVSYSEDPETFAATVQSCVDAYNASVKALVEEKQAEGINIRFADINSVVDMSTGLEDGVHPNEDGYAAMGKYWSEQILSYLGKEVTVTTTTTTTTTTTEETTTTTTTEETTTTITEETTTQAVTEAPEETTTVPDETTTSVADVPDIFVFANGDVNLDDDVTVADVVSLMHYLLGEDTLSYQAFMNADMTLDSTVNGYDLAVLRYTLLQTVPDGAED